MGCGGVKKVVKRNRRTRWRRMGGWTARDREDYETVPYGKIALREMGWGWDGREKEKKVMKKF